MKQMQKKFYDTRFSVLKRGVTKLQCPPILFYDTKLIKIMLKTSKTTSIANMLEVGCGQGTDAILISKHAGNVVAIDVSINALRVAKRLSYIDDCFRKMSFVVADAEYLPFRDGVFDVVFCKDLLHHVPDSVHVLSEMRRVTKIAGKVAAIEANACNPQMILIGLVYFPVDKGVFKNTKAALIQIFEKAGLSNVHAEKTEFLPRHLLFEYRSPLCSPVISKSKTILTILNVIEERMQSLSLVRNLSNYIIIHSLKKHE